MKDTKLQYKDTIRILIVYSYNWCVQYLCSGHVHKGNHQALGMSFLKTAQFLGSQFHDKRMTNKRCCQFNDALAQKNCTGKKDGMTELMTVEEGIFGCFYMDTDILLTLYYDIHNQQQPIGDMPWAPQHTMAPAWKRALTNLLMRPVTLSRGIITATF